jgi:hypothetical protein
VAHVGHMRSDVGCGASRSLAIRCHKPLATIYSHLKTRPQLRHYDPTTHVLWIQGSQASGCFGDHCALQAPGEICRAAVARRSTCTARLKTSK